MQIDYIEISRKWFIKPRLGVFLVRINRGGSENGQINNWNALEIAGKFKYRISLFSCHTTRTIYKTRS
jgi:hypothetical protein